MRCRLRRPYRLYCRLSPVPSTIDRYRGCTINVHAIYVALGEADLLEASARAIYQHVDAITVVTAHDRDWYGRTVAADDLVDRILDRRFDPDRKMSLLVMHETNQARAINRVMDLHTPSGASARVRPMHAADAAPDKVDYFWIIDADELYDESCVTRLLLHVERTRARYYQVASMHYFKSWNHRVTKPEWFTAFVRADQRLGQIRNPYVGLRSKIVHRLPALSADLRARLLGIERIDSSIGWFHHGSYVGPRARIARKVRSSPHAHQIAEQWLATVYDTWQPDATNFHPTDPGAFPAAERVPTAQLPIEIRGHPWPDGFLDTDSRG